MQHVSTFFTFSFFYSETRKLVIHLFLVSIYCNPSQRIYEKDQANGDGLCNVDRPRPGGGAEMVTKA